MANNGFRAGTWNVKAANGTYTPRQTCLGILAGLPYTIIQDLQTGHHLWMVQVESGSVSDSKSQNVKLDLGIATLALGTLQNMTKSLTLAKLRQ